MFYHDGTDKTYNTTLRLSGSNPYGVNFVYTDASGNVTYNCMIDENGDFIPSKAPVSHASTDTTYGLATTTYYGHVKLVNNITTTSYATGEALSAYQGYLLNQKAISQTISVGRHDTYTNCNVYFRSFNGVVSLLLCFGTGETYIVMMDVSYHYSKVGTSLSGSYLYKYQLCTGLGNYSSTTCLVSLSFAIPEYDDTASLLRLKVQTTSGTSFDIKSLCGFGLYNNSNLEVPYYQWASS